uniref:Uncharacterized protein n=1 Tax=Opuntia streptacantha TaxID=393608 RepID=A0A7C8ZRR7_OPUST
MSSTSPRVFKSCLITSLKLFLGLPLRLLWSKHTIVSALLTGASIGFLLICPNQRNLASLILSSIDTTPILILITSFLILYSLVWPHIHRIMDHAHLSNLHPLNLRLLNRPTLRSI